MKHHFLGGIYLSICQQNYSLLLKWRKTFISIAVLCAWSPRLLFSPWSSHSFSVYAHLPASLPAHGHSQILLMRLPLHLTWLTYPSMLRVCLRQMTLRIPPSNFPLPLTSRFCIGCYPVSRSPLLSTTAPKLPHGPPLSSHSSCFVTLIVLFWCVIGHSVS